MAVVGSGVAGLTAAYVLSQKYDVTLFEADDRLGGHVHTHDVVAPDIGSLAVDSGFIVHNEKTYPLLIRLFAELGVQTQPTDMSLSVRCEGCGLEYAGARGVGGLFAKPSSIFNGAFLNMLREVRVFHRRAREVLQDGGDELTYGEFLSSRGFSRYFINHFALPIVACVWSTSSESALRYPARYLFTFLDNHGMLAVSGSPQWRTVVGGSRTYVDRLAKELHSVATSTPVRTITRHHDGAEIRDDFDQVHRFDGVVVATHADTALCLLERPSDAERSVLSAFSYSTSETLLHTDERVLPRARRAQASWNYLLASCDSTTDPVLVSYDMNRLEAIDSATRHIVSLNSSERIDPDSVLARMRYEHPIYTTESLGAQRRLGELNGGVTAYAGAYHGWGFHEDGCRSGVEAAAAFGVTW